MRIGTLTALLLVLGATGAQNAYAQRQPGLPARADTVAPRRLPASEGADPAVLDRPISRAEYALGPGDVVSVSLFGDVTDQVSTPVTPEGTLVVAGIGVARVLGATLDQAEARVSALVARLYRNVEVRLSLERVRTFKVFVVGNVDQPGVRIASSVTRVSEVVPAVGARGVLRRNIGLRRSGGDTLRVDLVRFIQTGDLSANPTLREGDAVVVPVTDDRIQVTGRVAFPGQYEFRPGESLAEFLSIANGAGPFPSATADSIRLTRFSEAGQKETLVIPRVDAVGARGRAIILRPSDAVFVPEVANFRRQTVATVTGQVRRPGVYPIRADTTTVRELVEMAGGFTAEASLVNTMLRRQSGIITVRQELATVPDSALTDEERNIRQISGAGAAVNTVVIDFARLYQSGGEAYNQKVQNGDVLEVPRTRNEVTVLGAVLTPGVVQYVPGRTYGELVRLAGGYSRRADRRNVVIVRAGQGNIVSAEDAVYPRPGDQVVVPFRERHTLTERLAPVGAVVGLLSSVLLTIVTVRSL